MNRRSFLIGTVAVLLGATLALWFWNDLAIALESSAPSRSIGTVARGRLEHGKRLPTRGPNFRAYSRLGASLGRTSVHGTVRTVVLEAYDELARTRPNHRFVYGETGWPWGGSFWPHRTHQNGLVVDFMVPVVRGARPAELPTWPWRTFGYGIEFDSQGRYGDLAIDFPAVVAHLEALERAAARHGLVIYRVLFAPEFHRFIAATPDGEALLERLPFSAGAVWVRHDEHYHVEFRFRAGGYAPADEVGRGRPIGACHVAGREGPCVYD